MSRPSDYVDAYDSTTVGAESGGYKSNGAAPEIKLGVVGWLRWAWRQLTSMKTALILLLLLAVAAVPGSIFPQRSADPNGVIQYFSDNPDTAKILDSFQLFDVYSSIWFSSIYLLLFISLIGCIIPRIKHHWIALRSQPPRTPARLSRLPAYQAPVLRVNNFDGEAAELQTLVIEQGKQLLKRSGYRVLEYPTAKGSSLSGEKGFWRETGNLIFHLSLVGVLISVAIGSSSGFYGQRLLVVGQTFVNTLSAYDSFNPGRFFSDRSLKPFSITLEQMEVVYETTNPAAYGIPLDYTAKMTLNQPGAEAKPDQVKVNYPMQAGETDIYLLGNGYAPVVTVRDPEGKVVFTDAVPFLPQDTNLTSLGVIKVPDGLAEQLGMRGFFYPSQSELETGAYVSVFPDLLKPVLTLNVYQGDLRLNEGIPKSVYVLDIEEMQQIAGGDAPAEALELKVGETVQLPNGLGSVTLESVPRYASFDIHHDPGQLWVLAFALTATAGLITSLFVARRRVWIKVTVRTSEGELSAAQAKSKPTANQSATLPATLPATGEASNGSTSSSVEESIKPTAEPGSFILDLEYAALARSEDPGLEQAVMDLANLHQDTLKNKINILG